MKKVLLCLTGFFALVTNADMSPSSFFNPITEFNEGMYLGMGEYRSADGQKEHYASYAVFFPNDWELVYLSSRGTNAYSLHFDFNAQQPGFFTVEATEHYKHDDRASEPNHENTYEGHGFCTTSQCTFYARMNDDYLLETITFHPSTNKVYRLGSVHLRADDGAITTVAWEEELTRIDVGAEKFDQKI